MLLLTCLYISFYIHYACYIVHTTDTDAVTGLESPSLLHTLGSLFIDLDNPSAAVHYLRAALALTGAVHRTGRPNLGMAYSLRPEDVKLANTYNQLG